jgi:signal transduction histidine kinase
VPYTVTHLTPALGARLLLGTFLLATAGNWVVAAAVRRVTARWRPVALVLGYVLVGDVLVTVASGTAVLPGSPGTLLLTGVVAYPAFALSVAAGQAGLRHLLEVEQALAQAVSESRALSLAEHNRLLLARHRVARLLHADVQAQCVQAALALTRGNAGPGWSQALAGIVALLDDPGRDDPGPGSAPLTTGRPPTDPARVPTSAADQLGALLDAWRHALDVTVRAEDDVWPVLDADPARAELVLDAVSEGLTNAARHAAEPRAAVGLRTVAQGAGRVSVQIESPGVLTGAGTTGAAPGYGLGQLRSRALDLTLSQVGGVVRLQVTVP